ncbi:MAG: NAD(P)-dependent alcohol dehydrogenase [Patescibacteria group bacterium]
MKQTKSYAVTSPTSPFSPLTIERREVRPQDVSIEILYCGICHSDIHTARNEWPGTVYPCVPGHEIIGKVIEIGNEVNNFKIGDTVGVGCFVDSCRTCENCQNHEESYCLNGATSTYDAPDKVSGGTTYGGYSKQIIVDKDFVLKITHKENINAVAPLLCAGITTYSPLKHWRVGKGHKVGIVGLGGLGHMALKLAVSFGAEVTVLSRSNDKDADAKRLGAHHFEVISIPENVQRLSCAYDFIIDTVSAPHDYNLCLGLLKTNGNMICLGVPPEPAEINVFGLIGKRRSLSGSLVGGIKETQEMLDYCAEHNIVSDIEMTTIDKIDEAYERVLKGDVRYRFVIDMKSL